jgi:Cytochrome c7 and related cytochrome c
MAKEEKPLEYQRRIRDTKGVAQRIDLGYLNRPRLLAVMRSRLTWLLLAVAVAGSVPLVLGVGGSRKAIANGPVSEAHDLFAQKCEACHGQSFKQVQDKACQGCHDGAPHPALTADTGKPNAAVACAQCHMEHRGKAALAEVSSSNCTSCHADLKSHASGVTIKAAGITGFAAEKHPEFSGGTQADARPLRLNHAIHMPAQAKTIRGVNLPMKCGDCHVTDHNSPAGALLPVTFEQNCKQCHARELEFDVYHLLGPNGPPAPHTKDPKTIHDFISGAYRAALAANPAIVRKPLGNDLAPSSNWLERAVKDSEDYLFVRKCVYCHTMAAYAVVKPVNRIAGRFVEAKPEGEPWLPRSEFAHRRHRAVECESCHESARTSTKTADVLMPSKKTCLPCHAKSETGLDRCSLCHLYHNRSLENDRERRPTNQIPGAAQ